MTVNTDNSRITYTGDGASTAFPFPYYFLSTSDIKAYFDGAEQTSGFTVTGVENPSGGTVTFTTPPAIGVSLMLSREPDILQPTALPPNDPFPSGAVEKGLDKLTMIAQELQADKGRTVRFPVTESVDGQLPLAGDRANALYGFNSTGTPALYPVTASVGAGDLRTDTFVAGVGFTAGVTTSLTLSRAPASIANVQVHFDASYQGPDQIASLTGAVLTFTAPIPNGIQRVYVTSGTSLSVPISQPSIVVTSYGAVGDGVTDCTAAFQAVANLTQTGKVLSCIVPDGVYKLASNVTPGNGTVAWVFSQGASLTGTGTLPNHASAMSFITTPNVGKRAGLWHGTDANPTTDGTTATSYMQRVDQSVTADDASHLIFLQYNAMKRKAGGKGWLTTNYNYLEDASNSGAAQSVAVSGSAHATGNASVWALYGEAVSSNPSSTLTACELDAQNFSGVNYPYNDAFPVTLPFSCGLYCASVGNAKNSFAIGIGLAGSIANNWHVGLYLQTFSIDHIGIDIQAQPPTLINFKYGASTDGTGITPGGIGLDVGSQAVAAYGTAPNQCAIHLRDQRFGFGSYGFMQYNAANNFLEFWTWNGSTYVRRGYIDMAGADHAL